MQHYYQLSGHDNVKEIMAKFLTDRLHTPKPINAKNLNFQAGKSYVLVQSVKSIQRARGEKSHLVFIAMLSLKLAYMVL